MAVLEKFFFLFLEVNFLRVFYYDLWNSFQSCIVCADMIYVQICDGIVESFIHFKDIGVSSFLGRKIVLEIDNTRSRRSIFRFTLLLVHERFFKYSFERIVLFADVLDGFVMSIVKRIIVKTVAFFDKQISCLYHTVRIVRFLVG